MELSMDNSGMEESTLLHLIEVLGITLARLHATQAKEEHGLSDIVASIKFVNETVDGRVNSSQQQVPESSEVHVYESDFSEVSKSIDAIVDEARMVRGTSKPSASSKGPLSTPRDTITETPPKPKAADHKKKLEHFSQALLMRPKKPVSSVEDAEHSAALKWMENKGNWFNTLAQERCLNSTRQSTPCSEKCFPEKLNAERKFLDALWRIHSIPPHSSTNVEDDSAGSDLNEMEDEDGHSNITGTKNQVQAMTQRMQKNVEVLQAHCKLLEERYLEGNLLHLEDLPFKILNLEEKQCQHVGNHEEESVAEDDCWLPEFCWKVLASTDSDAIDAFHSNKPLLLSSPISACPVFPQTVSSREQESRRFTKQFKRVFVLSIGTLLSVQGWQSSSLYRTSDRHLMTKPFSVAWSLNKLDFKKSLNLSSRSS